MCLVTGCSNNSQLPTVSRKDLKKLCFKHALQSQQDGSGDDSDPLAWEDLAPHRVEETAGLCGVEEAVAGVKLESSGSDEPPSPPPAAAAATTTTTTTTSSSRRGRSIKSKDNKPRNKRLNKQSSEKRKEKSRDAARCRRSKESELYTSLSDCLPVPQQVLANLDKASIMRLAIACLNTANMISRGLRVRPPSEESEAGEAALRQVCGASGPDGSQYQEALLQAVDGFVLVLSANGDVAFVSTSIATYLGLAQVDVMGASLFDLVHQCDHEDLRQLLCAPPRTAPAARRAASTSSPPARSGRKAAVRRARTAARQGEQPEEQEEQPRHGFIRMKCTLANRGRNVTIRNASYKVVEVSGKLVQNRLPSRSGPASTNSNSGGTNVATLGWLICVAAPVPHPANIEVPLDRQTYFSKHSLDMKFTYADENFPQFCGFSPRQLEGQSLFQLHHELDGHLLRQAFATLRAKGQVSTGQYRFLAAGGGYVWLVTQATVIHAHKDAAATAVVCLHYVISGVESPGEVLSCIQLVGSARTSSRSPPSLLAAPSPTAGDVGLGGTPSRPPALVPTPPRAAVQAMTVTPQYRTNNNTAKTHQQKITGRRGSGLLAGVPSSIAGAVSSAALLNAAVSPPAPHSVHLTTPAKPSTAPHASAQEENNTPQPARQQHDLITQPINTADIPTINIDSSFVIVNETQQSEETKGGKNRCDTRTFVSSPEPGSRPCSESGQALRWLTDSETRPAPLLSQAAAGMCLPVVEQPQLPAASSPVTAPPACDPLNLERYLFPEQDAYSGSTTADLFADIDSSELHLLTPEMDIMEHSLFKHEPLYEGEEFDARAPFLPLCDDENLIMWSPSLVLDEDSTQDGASTPDYSSSLSCPASSNPASSCPASHSSSVTNSPVSNSRSASNSDSSSPSADSPYGPDGRLNNSAASSAPGEPARQHASNGCDYLKEEEDCCPPGSLLAELLQHNFSTGPKEAQDATPALDQPPSTTCIDPNRVWPGHRSSASPCISCKDEELLEQLLQEDGLQDYKMTASSQSSPSLASASPNTLAAPSVASCKSPNSSYSSSLSPAFSSFAPFSSKPSSPCSPRSPDPPLPAPVKRPSSPQFSSQMPRKRLCSPHVEEARPQLQPDQHKQQAVKSGRRLHIPNAPYMQQLLGPGDSEQRCGGRLVTLLPRLQTVSTRQPQNVYRVVADTAHTASEIVMTPTTVQCSSAPLATMMGGREAGRKLLLRGHSSPTEVTGASYLAKREVRPVRLVNERSVSTEAMRKKTTRDWCNDDGYEWLEVLDEGEQRPMDTKCLLLPTTDYSPVTMMRLTQTDYDVNAPAPSDLLCGQDLLAALDRNLQ